MFSGGSYDEVARWLKNFLTSHGKREDPRAEVILESGDEREGRSYAARLRLGARLSEPMARVALAAGFSNAKQLGASFQHETGSTPTAYRRKARS